MPSGPPQGSWGGPLGIFGPTWRIGLTATGPPRERTQITHLRKPLLPVAARGHNQLILSRLHEHL